MVTGIVLEIMPKIPTNIKVKNNPKAKLEMDHGIEMLNLVDVWRVKNPNAFKFTWWTSKPIKRLDYFLISHSILSLAKDCVIESRYHSDHAPIRLELKDADHKPGPGFCMET